MKVYVTREFDRFAGKNAIEDEALCEAVERAEKGLIDADLAGPLIKKRVARSGQGRSGGYRVVAVYRKADLALFLHGFPKSSKANLTRTEQEAFAEFGKKVLELTQAQLDAAVEHRRWRRLDCERDQEEVSE